MFRSMRRPLFLLGLAMYPAIAVAVQRQSPVFGFRPKFPIVASSPRTTRRGVLLLEPQQSTILLPEFLRGGSVAIDEDDETEDETDDEESEEESDDEEELDVDLDDADFDEAEDEFAEANHVQLIADAWKKTPPLTKYYLGASFAATAFGCLFSKNEFPSIFMLEWKPIATRFQLWRIFTAFLNFGPLGLGYFMTVHFVWTYMSTLERLHHKAPYDFWIMMIFGQVCMIIGYNILKLSPKFLGHNLSTYLVYIWSRTFEGTPVSVFDLFMTRAEILPWFFLAQTFLLEGEPPVLDFLGIVFGHIFYHCKKIGLLRAPPALTAWYQGDSPYAQSLRAQYKKITAEFELV